jgi:hypothetical protein
VSLTKRGFAKDGFVTRRACPLLALSGRGGVTWRTEASFVTLGVWVVDDKVIYPRGRSQYESSIIYLGDQRQSFIEEFYEVGWVAEGVVYYSDD